MTRWQSLRALVVLLALGSSVACANILGIDSPTPLDGSAAAAGQSAGAAAGNASLGESGATVTSGGSAGEAEAGSGGEAAGGSSGDAGAESGGQAGTGGSAGAAAQAGSAGSAQAGNAGSAASLYVDGPELTTLCPGAAGTLALTAMGGVPPYRWKLLGDAQGFALLAGGANGATATLSGSLTAPAQYQVQVQVSDANSASFQRSFSISVPSTPAITLTSVPSVCPNEVYSVQLTAVGGDPTTYQWSTDLPGSTGIKVQGNLLQGKFAGSGGASHAPFTLRVADGGSCPSAPVSLDLAFEQASAQKCPEVRVVKRAIGGAIPQPCYGSSYREQLVMLRGLGTFQWGSDATPPGLSFDPLTQAVSGISTGAGTLTVHATDSVTKRTIETSFDVEPRDKCWLAYLSQNSASQQLHFFDAVLTDDSGNRGRTKTLVSGTVNDFKFSPDGKYLAYRYGATGSPLSISIVKLATWQESALGLSDVTGYQWSANSALLAVAYSTDQGAVLGVVDVTHPAPGAASAPLVFPPLPTVVASLASDPVWFGGNQLAFFAPSFAPPLVSLATISASANGFGALGGASAFFLSSDRLVPGPSGVFVVSSATGISFFGSDGSGPIPHDAVLIAPSGRYVARAQQGSLALFRATDPSSGDGAPYATQPGCSTVLGWATGTERIACAHETGGAQDELAFFDVNPQSDALNPGPTVALSGLGSTLIGKQRVFSPDGARFAYTSDATLNVATAAGGTATIAQLSVDTSGSNIFSELEFAPNSLLLLQHRGSKLGFFNLADLQLAHVFEEVLQAAPSCEEDFKALDFCGLEPTSPSVLWSPGSDLAAFQSATGTLEVEDLTWQGLGYFEPVHVDPSCGAGCVVPGQFEFQP